MMIPLRVPPVARRSRGWKGTYTTESSPGTSSPAAEMSHRATALAWECTTVACATTCTSAKITRSVWTMTTWATVDAQNAHSRPPLPLSRGQPTATALRKRTAPRPTCPVTRPARCRTPRTQTQEVRCKTMRGGPRTADPAAEAPPRPTTTPCQLIRHPCLGHAAATWRCCSAPIGSLAQPGLASSPPHRQPKTSRGTTVGSHRPRSGDQTDDRSRQRPVCRG